MTFTPTPVWWFVLFTALVRSHQSTSRVALAPCLHALGRASLCGEAHPTSPHRVSVLSRSPMRERRFGFG